MLSELFKRMIGFVGGAVRSRGPQENGDEISLSMTRFRPLGDRPANLQGDCHGAEAEILREER